ncbi:MAG: PHP domain-containing protein [archaeon]
MISKKYDLHLHSYYSDGSSSIAEIINILKEKKINAFSITDHNCIYGLNEAETLAKKNNLEFINGVEINAKHTEILAYFFNEEDSQLNRIIEKNKIAKEKIAIEKLEKLQDNNVNIEVEDLYLAAANSKAIATTHLAKALVTKKLATTIQHAFDKFNLNKLNISSYERFLEKEVIKAIVNANGVAVLPHPSYLSENIKLDFENYLIKLKTYGLSGIELNYPYPLEHKEFVENTKILAKEIELIPTAGSDYHDINLFPENKIGKFTCNEAIIKKLKERISDGQK